MVSSLLGNDAAVATGLMQDSGVMLTCVKTGVRTRCVACRQAVKLLKLDPESSSTSSDTLPIHGSLASAAAWRYAQLLSALPKRDTEASAWQEFATRHWQLVHHQSQSSELDKVLGPLDVLKGGKDESPGVIVDLILLRGLPCFIV